MQVASATVLPAPRATPVIAHPRVPQPTVVPPTETTTTVPSPLLTSTPPPRAHNSVSSTSLDKDEDHEVGLDNSSVLYGDNTIMPLASLYLVY